MIPEAPLWLDRESDSPSNESRASILPWIVLAGMTVLFAAGFAWLSVARHAAFQSNAYDLGHMDQAVWNTLHGHPLRFTDMEVHGRVLTNRLGIHVEPLLIALAPAYFIHSGPDTLLVLQATIVALGALPAYLLALRALGHQWLSLVFPAAYLLHPSLQNAVLDDFHAVTLSACFLLWAIYFAARGSMGWFGVAAVLAAATKEEVAAVVAAMGVGLIVLRHRREGIIALFGGIAWFLISLLVIVPAFNPGGRSPYLARYSYLGHGALGVVGGILRHPDQVAAVLTSPTRLLYLDVLLQPLGLVPLLGFPALLLASPTFLINMLSTDPTMYSGYYQYSAEIVPFVVAAAILAVLSARAFSARYRPGARGPLTIVLCVAVLAGALIQSRQYGFSPLAVGYAIPSTGVHQQIEERLLAGIPGGSVVAAADEIEPHLSDRFWIYTLPVVHPVNGPVAQYIVLDASIPSLPVTPRAVHAVAERALRGHYGVQQARDGVLILRRGLSRRALPPTFYTFALSGRPLERAREVHWGAMQLVGFTVHPRDRLVNLSRPAIEVESFWRLARPASSTATISFYLSPVYSGAHPRFSARWQVVSGSPTTVWLPTSVWPVRRIVTVASLPLLPNIYQHGSVDVAVGLRGGGQLSRGVSGVKVGGAPNLLRVATIRVGY